MSHVRQQIRDAAVTLVTDLATTENRVYASRLYPVNDSEYPGLCVYTGDEEVESVEISGSGNTQQRTVDLIVEGFDKASGGLDDRLDSIAAEVETVIFTDPYFSDLAKSCELASVVTEMTDEGEKPIGIITLTFRVMYFTIEGAPETAL